MLDNEVTGKLLVYDMRVGKWPLEKALALVEDGVCRSSLLNCGRLMGIAISIRFPGILGFTCLLTALGKIAVLVARGAKFSVGLVAMLPDLVGT